MRFLVRASTIDRHSRFRGARLGSDETLELQSRGLLEITSYKDIYICSIVSVRVFPLKHLLSRFSFTVASKGPRARLLNDASSKAVRFDIDIKNVYRTDRGDLLCENSFVTSILLTSRS